MPAVTDALEALAVLADPVRRQLLVHLVDRDVCTCGDLVEELGVGQPTVSHHLKILREAGLVTGERCGRYVNYRVVPGRLSELGGALTSLGERAAERTDGSSGRPSSSGGRWPSRSPTSSATSGCASTGT